MKQRTSWISDGEKTGVSRGTVCPECGGPLRKRSGADYCWVCEKEITEADHRRSSVNDIAIETSRSDGTLADPTSGMLEDNGQDTYWESEDENGTDPDLEDGEDWGQVDTEEEEEIPEAKPAEPEPEDSEEIVFEVDEEEPAEVEDRTEGSPEDTEEDWGDEDPDAEDDDVSEKEGVPSDEEIVFDND
jgi:uncharacterized Zn finger protein (UPF0148 family)